VSSVEDRNPVTGVGEIQGEIGPHHGQAYNPDVG
jgi:hypothetical protein